MDNKGCWAGGNCDDEVGCIVFTGMAEVTVDNIRIPAAKVVEGMKGMLLLLLLLLLLLTDVATATGEDDNAEDEVKEDDEEVPWLPPTVTLIDEGKREIGFNMKLCVVWAWETEEDVIAAAAADNKFVWFVVTLVVAFVVDFCVTTGYVICNGLYWHFLACVRILLDCVNAWLQFGCGQTYGLQPVW